MQGLKTILVWSAVVVMALAIMAYAGPTNATAVNAAKANITAVNATTVANVTQTSNMTEVYVVTPSGTIHLVYVSNGTVVVINYNKKVITANLKTTIYNGTTAYYIHVVGHALGTFNSTYVSQLLSQAAAALKAGNTTQALSLLKQLAGYVATNNGTRKAELNIMLTAKSLNSTAPNATYLKAKIEYELERGLKKVNGTRSELEVEAFVSNYSEIAKFLNAVASQIAPYSPSDAAQLRAAASVLANITAQIKELEIKLANGTQIEIHKTGHGYKVEVQVGGEHEDHDKGHEHDDHGGAVAGGHKGEDHEDKSSGKHNVAGSDDHEDNSSAATTTKQGKNGASSDKQGSKTGGSHDEEDHGKKSKSSSGDEED
ncbi:MAG: hypothetical protein ACP5MH_06760 [Thermoproteus sp.]